MKLIKPSFLIKEQEPGLEGIYKQIEWAGRHCYKSLDKITEDSAKKFVDRMIKSQHYSVLEHGTVYLQFFWTGTVCQHCNQTTPNKLLDKYANNKYSIVNYHGNDVYVTSNLRVLVENNWLDDLKYLCEPTEYHEKRICVKFVCDRGILAEFTRHRTFSFSAESSRYCNYSKDKFNNEITYILPCWTDLKEDSYSINDVEEPYDRCLIIGKCANLEEAIFIRSLCYAEKNYLELIKAGWKPQQARAVLPNALKTELVMTGFVSDWKHFFSLRSNKYGKGGAHPSASELADPLYEEFIKNGLV